MIPVKNKLRTPEVKKVFVSPTKVFSSDIFKILAILNGFEHSKFAVVVPKTVTKKVIERNSLKRRVFSALSSVYKDIKPGMYVIIVNNKTADTDISDVESEFKRLLI